MDKYNTVEEIIEDCKNKGHASWGDYYIEYKKDTFFEKAMRSAWLYEYAHPDSMSPNHCLKGGTLEELALDLMLYNKPDEDTLAVPN